MKDKKVIWPFFIGLMAGAISHWLNPYNTTSFAGVSIYLLLCVSVFSGSFILALTLPWNPAKIFVWLWAGAAVAIVARIIFDIVQISGSHNLFPFEIIITSVVILASAFTGAYLAQLIKYLKIKLQ